MMKKDKIIQFRVTELQYQRLQSEAQKEGIKVSELAARRVLNNTCTGNISPSIALTLRSLYDMLEFGAEAWNDKTAQNYKEGLERLNVYFKRG
ncbi:MAG: plasmid mobilization protein [Ruminiclostridium sp.]